MSIYIRKQLSSRELLLSVKISGYYLVLMDVLYLDGVILVWI